MNPKTEALALRIWQHCEPIGWDCYAQDVADALGVSMGRVRGVIQYKGWTGRLRTRKQNPADIFDAYSADSLDGGNFYEPIYALTGRDL